MTYVTCQVELRDARLPPSDIGFINLIWTDLPATSSDRLLKTYLDNWTPKMWPSGHICITQREHVGFVNWPTKQTHYLERVFNSDNFEKYLTKWILHLTRPGDLVVDPFCGWSTVGVVARRLDRRYYGCDTSPIAIQKSLEVLPNGQLATGNP